MARSALLEKVLSSGVGGRSEFDDGRIGEAGAFAEGWWRWRVLVYVGTVITGRPVQNDKNESYLRRRLIL